MNYKKQLDNYRPIPFYFLTTTDPAAYTEEAVFEAMQKMKDDGFGGIVLFNKPPVGFDADLYLSDYWFDITARFIQACRKLKMQLWCSVFGTQHTMRILITLANNRNLFILICSIEWL